MMKEMLCRAIESLMSPIAGRDVEVSFSHLGQGKDYSVAVQTTLYQFDENVDGPKGPMYITLNAYLLQDTRSLIEVLNKIVASLE
jgi:hypothetical protein